MKTLGPFKRGEIPDPQIYVFEDVDGNPIPALPEDYIAKVEYRRYGGDVVEVDGTIVDDPAPGSAAERCAVRWEWPADAMAVAADFTGEAWAGLDAANKYASETLTWTVEPSVAAPTLVADVEV